MQATPTTATSGGIKRLLLLGAGHAHVHVLAHLATHQRADLQVTVLTPHGHQTYSGMTPGLVAGCYTEADCQIPLAPLVQAAGARWVAGRCTHIDAAQQRVHVAATPGMGDAPALLPYDWLSIDTGGVLERERVEAAMPGAGEHALAALLGAVTQTLDPLAGAAQVIGDFLQRLGGDGIQCAVDEGGFP